MRKAMNLTRQFAMLAPLLSGLLLGSSAFAQTVPTALATEAEAACIKSAESKGFTLREVVSITPKAGTDNGATVVLNLDRDGQLYKLTCGYTETEGALFDGNDGLLGANSPTYNPNLWWLLLPLIGLPLLLWWAAGRKEPVHRHASDSYTETVVQSRGRMVDIHAGPGKNYSITGTLYDGQAVRITGRHQQDWTELLHGGWVPTETLALGSRYAAH